MKRKSHILLVDDDSTALELLSEVLIGREFDVDSSVSVDDAILKLKARNYHALVTDLKMPRKTGMELLEFAVETLPELPVIVLTAYGTIQNAVTALKKGAFDYITKPVEVDELTMVLQRAISHSSLREQNKFLRAELMRRDEFLYRTESPLMAKVFTTLDSVRDVQTTVLLQGESGTGKEMAARYLHALSPRSAEPFVPINCGAIPETLIESELFGYDEGAFTDAKHRTKGKLEIADGGTLFMDEINELPPKAQAAVLRFLQEPEITPLGSTRRIALNVRVIVATNKNLKELVRTRQFREDLYYRINVLPIVLPPLRERREDILPLADWFFERLSREHGRKSGGLSEPARKLLLGYEWPGNIRELRNCIERAIITSRGEPVRPESLHIEPDCAESSDFSGIGVMELHELEQRYIHWAFHSLGGNKTATAARLGISLRGLRYKLNDGQPSK